MSTALVTGATSGIGATFARHLAARGDNLVLVARDVNRLETTAAGLREEFDVEVEVLPADLSIRDDVQRVAARLEDAEHPVDTLVNNAGFGFAGTLLDIDVDIHARAFDVMCLAVLVLGAAAGRAMKARRAGTIINVGSTASHIATGNYSAVKAWVANYSESLAAQLGGTGVTVTNLEPGWVRTEFHQRAGINASKLPDFLFVDVDILVRDALADAARGHTRSIPTLGWKVAIVVAERLAPRAAVRWFSRKLSSSRENR